MKPWIASGIVREQRGQGPFFLFVIVLLLMGAGSLDVWACRVLEPPADRSDTLWVHLEGFCFSNDQRTWAVKGVDVIQALKDGQDIDLQGVLVAGDVMLDQLPLQHVAEIPNLPAAILARLQQRGLDSVRVISGAVTIRDSQFEKVLATNLAQGALVMLGKVDVSGTTFLQSVDFSKTIFAKPLVFTNVHVDYEGFFIGTHFEKAVDFSHTTFGTHVRFHKAIFRAPVMFAEVQFKGVAEFLEVEFQEEANFSQAHFFSGTGFSGSVFHGPVDFSEVVMKREIYFRFSEFKQRASFRHAQFQNVVDFSNSRFEGTHDLAEAEFAVQPDFTGSNSSVDVVVSRRWLDQQSRWWVFGGLFVVVAVYFLWLARRNREAKSA
jgi:uncharacterized protein YjbI with pentapeptide repeats